MTIQSVMDNETAISPAVTYDQDFYAWAKHNAALLRQGRFIEIDAENIAEELDAMSRSEKRELVSHLAVLLAHLLKWQHQPNKHSRSWEYTLVEQRRKVQEVLEDSPSLKYDFEEKLDRAYSLAILSAARETGLLENAFSLTCPYSPDQVFDESFYPI